MIIFDKLWMTMKEKGVSTYVLREKFNIDSKTIRKLRKDGVVTTFTLSKLCSALNCKLSDIAEFSPEYQESEK